MNAVAQTTAPVRLVRPPSRRPAAGPVVVRQGTAADAPAIHALILDHLQEGHLLPRSLEEIAVHAERFAVGVAEDTVVACAELAPLSHTVAEVRSLVVSDDARGGGIGRRLVDELVFRATSAGFDRLCAFAHAPGYFLQMGFSIVPHVWLPEKIVTDCHACLRFRQCGQYAVIRPLFRARGAHVPLTALHG